LTFPTAADPTSGLPFSILEQHYGKPLAYVATLLLITSIFGAMLSFHNGVGRYVFGLSREGVLPQVFSRVGLSANRAGAPIGGSVPQSAVALLVLGPDKLPGMLRTLGQWLARLRKLTTEVRYQSGIDDVLRAEGLDGGLSELRGLMRGGLSSSVLAAHTAAQQQQQPPMEQQQYNQYGMQPPPNFGA